MSAPNWTRRKFLEAGATATAAAMAAKSALAQDAEKAEPAIEYRMLGKTGMKVTTVGVGCMVTPEPVIAKALDMGINWFDTAHSYKGGKNEVEVGRVFKGKRDKAYVCTKISPGSVEGMLKALDGSLQRLQMDHVDMLLAHGVERRAGVLSETTIAALQKAKEAGKTRFIGFSTHASMTQCINAAIEAKVYDAVLTKYSYSASHKEGLNKAIADAAAAGIGIIAMKTQNGSTTTEGLSPHQSLLKWVLDNPNISLAVPGMREFKHLEEDFAVMGKRLTLADRVQLERFDRATAAAYCTSCDSCSGTCPLGVDIPEVRRCAMYLDVYGEESMARETYRSLASNAAPCPDCSTCTAQCIRGASLQAILSRTHSRLA